MAYDALAIANYFLDKAKADGKTLNPMGLQKLVYYAHGWHLAMRNQPLVVQRVQAWDYGPVIPEIYREFKEFGRRPINRRATCWEFDDSAEDLMSLNPRRIEPEIRRDDQPVHELLNKVWDVYKDYSAVQLSNMTHEDGTPWHQVKQVNQASNAVIDDHVIREWFAAKAKENASRRRSES